MHPYAVVLAFNLVHHPKMICRVVVKDDPAPGTDKQLPRYFIVYVLALVNEQVIPGRSINLSGIIYGEEFYD